MEGIETPGQTPAPEGQGAVAPTLSTAQLLAQPPAEALNPEQQAEAAKIEAETLASNAYAFAGPDSPSEYTFPKPFGSPIPDINTPAGKAAFAEHAASEQAFREFLHSEGVPVTIAKELDRQAMLAHANPPTEVQRAQTYYRSMEELSRTWGADLDGNLAIAEGEVLRMAKSNPHIVGILDRTGLCNSAWLAISLVNIARAKGRVK